MQKKVEKKDNTSVPKVETSHAILRLSGKYILQLRDDKPGIAARGQWSLFGGEINTGETPLEAMKRELFEELLIKPGSLRFLWHKDYYHDFIHGIIRTWFFASDIDDVWNFHQLREGRDVNIFSYQDLNDLDIPAAIKESLDRFHLESAEDEK